MGDTDYILFDNRTFVQVGGHVMAGSANQFHSALKSLVIRFRAYKRRKERVMDVEDAAFELLDELRR